MEGRIRITESVTDPGKPITNKQWIPKNGAVTANLATLMNSYYLWIEDNGFVIISKPEPTGTEDSQRSLVAVVEL
jgi:hypothetical protein